MRAPLLFESDHFVFAVKADDGTERVYRITVNRGGTASLSLLSGPLPLSEAEQIEASFHRNTRLA